MENRYAGYTRTPYAELHLHFGGAISPRILWNRVVKEEKSKELKKRFHDFNKLQHFFERKKSSLEEYIKIHKLIEPLQQYNRIEYFMNRLIRGACEFESLSYMELRYCPYGRTSPGKEEPERIAEMRAIVLKIDECIKKYTGVGSGMYPIIVKQILCMHSQHSYSPNVNSAILDLAIEMHEAGVVAGLDVAGGEKNYAERSGEFIAHFKRAKENGLHTTAHLFESAHTPKKMFELLPWLNRVGHGIQIPLKHPRYMELLQEKQICLEVCPTTYFKCGTFSGYDDKHFHKIFTACEKNGVPLVIGTDNSGIHNVRLQREFENLLLHDVISHEQLTRYRKNAFRFAFGLNNPEKEYFINQHSFVI
jgi:adenosine deaminase